MNNSNKIKVCGMRDSENIRALIQLKPDYIGFIFYPKSKRYVEGMIDMDVVAEIPDEIKKTGVFVNETKEKVTEIISRYELKAIQLHGDESPEYCQQFLNQHIEVIKAFRVKDNFNFEKLKEYEKSCNYFLFDTDTKNYGGSGKKFNWKILENYASTKPFFLSGGIGPEDADDINLLLHQKGFEGHEKIKNIPIFALDINSQFEIKPALKDIEKVTEFINNIRHE